MAVESFLTCTVVCTDTVFYKAFSGLSREDSLAVVTRPHYCNCKLTGEGYFVIHRGKESLCLQKEFLGAKSGWSAFISNKKGM